MADIKPRVPTHYAYRPASSMASEAILSDAGVITSPTETKAESKQSHELPSSATESSSSPNAFRPAFPTRSSFNYVEAEAAARSAQGSSSTKDVVGSLSDADLLVKPKTTRQQSWSEQEFKHQMQGRLMEGEKAAGFSEIRK